MRQNVYADLHFHTLALIFCALDYRAEYIRKLVAQEDGYYCGRSLACPQSVVISGGGNASTQNILMLVDCLDYSCKYQQELCIFSRGLSGIEQVDTCVCGKRPVTVLARAVYSLKGFFVKQTFEVVLSCSTLHYLHRKLVMVGGDIHRVIYRSKLMLRWGSLVMFCFCVNAQPPQLLVNVFHVCGNSGFYGAEIVVVKLLTLWCRGAEKGPSGKDKILSVGIHISVDKEVFLLGTCVGNDPCCV